MQLGILYLHTFSFDVEKPDKELDGSALYEDGEEDHEEGGGDERVLVVVAVLEDFHQGESHRPPETAVGQDHLLLEGDLLDAVGVDDGGESQDPDEADQCAEQECPEGESVVKDVPLVVAAHGGDAQEEEDDAVGEPGQGPRSILDRRVALFGNVSAIIVRSINPT